MHLEKDHQNKLIILKTCYILPVIKISLILFFHLHISVSYVSIGTCWWLGMVSLQSALFTFDVGVYVEVGK